VSPWADLVEPLTNGRQVYGHHLVDLVRVLQIAHTKLGICHRDVKPANIFIYKDKIILNDWGSACTAKEPVLWEGTKGFYTKYTGEKYPEFADDLIAFVKSAYLMVFNCCLPWTDVDSFWNERIINNTNTVWNKCYNHATAKNYDALITSLGSLK
jgi:serine/threonine protein kinase